MPIYNDNGKPDARIAMVLLDSYNKIVGRLRGSEVQRVEQKKLDVKVNVESSDDDLRKKIDEMKKKLGYVKE